MRFDHRIVMELLRTAGEIVGHTSFEPDWEPAIECTRLAGLRAHGVWAPEAAAEQAIEPVWHGELGEPYMRGFRVHLASRDSLAWHADFPLRYFVGPAQAAAARLIEEGVLAAGERFRYRTLAYERPAAGGDARPEPFLTVDQPPPLAIRDACRQPLIESSAVGGEGDIAAADFDVFIRGHVLDEAVALTERANEIETGGVLIGHLERDPVDADIFVEITALIPARHTVGESKKLTFTSDTWTDARRALELRRRDELVVGWFHSHPQFAWCRERGCPLDQQRQCSAARGFFSADDLALHRTMFPRAFMVALVMTRSVNGTVPRLFAWRDGCFEPRGFRVLTGA